MKCQVDLTFRIMCYTMRYMKKNVLLYIGLAAIVIFAIVISRNRDFKLPTSGESKQITTTVDVGGTIETVEIMETDGVKHSVPLEEILGGGPPKDGIPSIDTPRFIPISEATTFLKDDDIGLSVTINNITRFYPYQILVWHEIVNDDFEGEPVLITYCPLCYTGIVFERVIKGESIEFGTSGKLWNSNLVMYDRKTDSLWSQIKGEAIVGEMTGTTLETLPSDTMEFGVWKENYPSGEVLSRDTGIRRNYEEDPYGDYYTRPIVYFPVNAEDDRIEKKDVVMGIVIDGKAKAYHTEAIRRVGSLEDEFQGVRILVEHIQEEDVVRMYDITHGKKTRLHPHGGFWFAWVAAYPNTELYF